MDGGEGFLNRREVTVWSALTAGITESRREETTFLCKEQGVTPCLPPLRREAFVHWHPQAALYSGGWGKGHSDDPAVPLQKLRPYPP